MEFKIGNYKEYYWFESHQINLTDIIKKLPELLIGKFLIISHFDGGKFIPNKNEINIGWKNENGMTYAEKITKQVLKMNIYDNYDQWILMNERTQITGIKDYVNYDYFSLIDWQIEKQSLNDEDDLNFINQYEKDRVRLKNEFWKEIEILNPLNFISDGSKFIFVTKEPSEMEILISTVANNGSSQITGNLEKV